MDQPVFYRDWGQRARGLIGVEYRWRLQSQRETISGREHGVHRLNKVCPQRLPYLRLRVAIAISLFSLLSPAWRLNWLWPSSTFYDYVLQPRSRSAAHSGCSSKN